MQADKYSIAFLGKVNIRTEPTNILQCVSNGLEALNPNSVCIIF